MCVVTDCAVKGIGPGAMNSNIRSWHELEWQKKENLCAKYVLNELHQHSIGNNSTICRNNIEKCPYYFSDEIGGCVPSKNWLIEMFCIIVCKN